MFCIHWNVDIRISEWISFWLFMTRWWGLKIEDSLQLFTTWVARSLCSVTHQGLTFLHSLGISHNHSYCFVKLDLCVYSYTNINTQELTGSLKWTSQFIQQNQVNEFVESSRKILPHSFEVPHFPCSFYLYLCLHDKIHQICLLLGIFFWSNGRFFFFFVKLKYSITVISSFSVLYCKQK